MGAPKKARLYGVKVSVHVEKSDGESHATFDGRPPWQRDKPAEAG